MSQRENIIKLSNRIVAHMPHLSKPQAFVLAAASLGVALARRCTLGIVAEALSGIGKPDTVERRLQRFLDNGSIDWKQSCMNLSEWVLSALPEDALIVLLVDETTLRDKLRVMVVSLAYRGRAIPIAWWCYHNENWPMGQVELVSTLLEWVRQGVPEGRKVLVEADRGIGTSPELLRKIESFGWYYLVRVQASVRLILDDGKEVAFSALVPKRGKQWCGMVHAFKKAKWLRCWAVGRWMGKFKEPWLLLTNWPKAKGSWYGLRMWEELAFRDLKSNGFQWQRSHVYDPEHAGRLWLIMAVGGAWVLSAGTHAIRNKRIRKQFTRGRTKRRSVFQIGLRFIKHFINLGYEMFYELFLIPLFNTAP